jgi:hypothetical protein
MFDAVDTYVATQIGILVTTDVIFMADLAVHFRG